MSTTANHSTASFQLVISETETAAPAEDHVLPLRRATRVMKLKSHPNPQPYPVRSCIGWAETPLHSHPKAQPSASKDHPKRVWMGILGAVTMAVLWTNNVHRTQCARSAIRIREAPSRAGSDPRVCTRGPIVQQNGNCRVRAHLATRNHRQTIADSPVLANLNTNGTRTRERSTD